MQMVQWKEKEIEKQMVGEIKMGSRRKWVLVGSEEERAEVKKCESCKQEKNFEQIAFDKEKLKRLEKSINERYCKNCGIEKTPENTMLVKRASGNGYRLDSVCYQCRKAEQQKRNSTMVNGSYVAKKSNSTNRVNSPSWRKRMELNPHYFSEIFHKPATPENIEREAQKLGM
jgi:hypothetical protein